MKKFFVFILIVLLAGLGVGYYMWNKPHSDIESQSATSKLSATELFNAYGTNETSADDKYLGKVLLITGKIMSMDKANDGTTNILLDTGDPMSTIMCQLDKYTKHDIGGLSAGSQVTLKGICSGFNGDVVIDRCVIQDRK